MTGRLAHSMMHQVFTAKLNWMRPMCMGNTTCRTPTEPYPMARNAPTSPATPNAASSETDAVLAAIAKTHLGLEILESRHLDSLDFHEHACYAIRDALAAAFAAGKRASRSRSTLRSAPCAQPTVVEGDLVLTSPKPVDGCGGWVNGRIGAFRFCAKVYPAHAEVASYEIGRSRISKLDLRRLDTDAVAYAWDRGLDVAPVNAAAKKAVERLAAHLANHCFGPCA
jgi:hypothetical protein